MADDFDPDAFLSKTAPSKEGEFDPDAFLKSEASSEASPPEDVTAGMALRGIPVLGAYIPQAEAAIRAAVHPLTGVGEKGDTYAERYAKNLPKREADYTKAETDSPIASTALQMAGGAAALAPFAATAVGARVLGGAGTLGQRVLAGGASSAGISAADALARGEDATTAAGIGAGIGAALPVVGAAAGRIGRASRGFHGAPTADELAPVVDHGYTTLRNAGVEFNPTSVNRAIQQIAANSDLHPTLTPDTISLLAGKQKETAARSAGSMSALTGVQPTARAGQTFDDLDTLRKHLGAVARNYNNPTEQLAARNAMRGIDDYLANVTPADVLRGNASQIAATAKEARGNAAAEFRLRAMNAIRERAELAAGKQNSGMNVENNYRREAANFIKPNNKGISPAMKEGFAPQEIYQIRKATRGTSFPNMLRMISNMLGGGHGVISGAGLLASYHTGDPRYAMAAGAGMAGRRLSNHMMRSRADKLARMTAARSPLASVKGTGGPMGPPLNLNPALQAGAIGVGANLPQQPSPPPYRRGGLVNHYDEGGNDQLEGLPSEQAARAEQARMQQILASAPEWVPYQPPELTPDQISGNAGVPITPDPTEQQQALLGHFGEDRRQEAAQSLLNYVKSHPPAGFSDVQEDNTFHPPMIEAAGDLMDRVNYPNDLPDRIRATGGDFKLDDQFSGADLFGGQLPKELPVSSIPKPLQPLLGPSVAQRYANQQANLWAPPWSTFFAPPAPVLAPEDKPWTGITYYDAWHRPLGAYTQFSTKRGGTIPRPGLAR